jgi:hypothetical protein
MFALISSYRKKNTKPIARGTIRKYLSSDLPLFISQRTAKLKAKPKAKFRKVNVPVSATQTKVSKLLSKNRVLMGFLFS